MRPAVEVDEDLRHRIEDDRLHAGTVDRQFAGLVADEAGIQRAALQCLQVVFIEAARAQRVDHDPHIDPALDRFTQRTQKRTPDQIVAEDVVDGIDGVFRTLNQVNLRRQ